MITTSLLLANDTEEKNDVQRSSIEIFKILGLRRPYKRSAIV